MSRHSTARVVLGATLLLVCAIGCASPEPWERSAFARAHMAPDADEPGARLRAHVYQSREGTTPLDRSAGGGCGCY